ncbi:unnamed protein product, partial [Laminaria digitata]
ADCARPNFRPSSRGPSPSRDTDSPPRDGERAQNTRFFGCCDPGTVPGGGGRGLECPDISFMAEGGGQSQQLGRMNSHAQAPLQQLNQPPPLSSRPTSPPSSVSPPRVGGQMAAAPHVGAGIGAQT